VTIDLRARHLIRSLGLLPHPEGGYYREVYRSPSRVQPCDVRPERASITTIYFLLCGGEVSRWHRVSSDEVWHFYEGDPLELFGLDADLERLSRVVVGPVTADTAPVHVVQAHSWQAARSVGAHSLAGCTVGPGFEFEDFQMLRDLPEDSEALRLRHPGAGLFL
jgi:predicted cupin superfamily sugar epimerase